MTAPEADSSEWLPVSELATRLGRNTRWVHRAVKALEIRSQRQNYGSYETPCYPPGTLQRLHLESERLLLLYQNSRQEELTIKEMADRVGRSYGWIKKTLDLLSIKPIRHEQRKAFRTAIYSPRALASIRQELAPASDDWYNLKQLVDHTQFDREWIERRLGEAGICAELRQSVLTGRTSDFYPPAALQLIEQICTTKAAGEWLTATALTDVTGKSASWTNRRLAKEDLDSLKEQRLDDQSVPRWHYPPCVQEELKRDLLQTEDYLEAGSYLPLGVVANMVGRHPVTIKRQLKRMPNVVERRRDKKGRIGDHYPPELVEQLRQHFESRTEAATWITVAFMATQLGVPREVVIERLAGINTRSQRREMASTKRVETLYSPNVARKLRRSFQQQPYDELVSSVPAANSLQELHDSYGLTYREISSLLGVTTLINNTMRQQRIRRSLADKIMAIKIGP